MSRLKTVLPLKQLLLSSLSVLALAALSMPAQAQQQLISNGNFETGNFTGWLLANQANTADIANQDHFYVSTPGANTPVSNFPTAPNPQGGNHYAVTDSNDPGAHALIQSFTVPFHVTKLTLTYQMFVNDQSGFGPVIDPTGLDYTTGGTFNDNQQARVDILTSGASSLSTASADVVKNFYDSVDGTNPAPYTTYTYDLTGLLTAGQTYQLRFAEVDNLGTINQGVDNVGITAFTSPVPEAGSFAAFTLLASGAGLMLRRRKTQQAI